MIIFLCSILSEELQKMIILFCKITEFVRYNLKKKNHGGVFYLFIFYEPFSIHNLDTLLTFYIILGENRRYLWKIKKNKNKTSKVLSNFDY